MKSKNELNILHDRIYDIYDVSCTHVQIKKLLTLCRNEQVIDDVLDSICLHFLGMKIPMYGSTQDYKDIFWKAIETNKEKFLTFIDMNTNININDEFVMKSNYLFLGNNEKGYVKDDIITLKDRIATSFGEMSVFHNQAGLEMKINTCFEQHFINNYKA